MPTLQELEKAMMEQRRGSAIMQQRALESMENQDRYNTTRFSGLLPGLIETVVDKIQKKRTAPEHQAALRNAVDHASGLEELEAKYKAMVAEQELAEKQKAAEAGGYTAGQAQAVARGIDLPKATPAPRGVMAEIPDGRGGTRKVLLDPTSGQPMQDYGTMPQTGAAKAPSYMDLVNPQTGATEKRMVGPDGRPGDVIGVSKAAPKEEKVAVGKEADIKEALTILDKAEEHINSAKWYQGTGPLDQYAPGHYQQTTKAMRDQLFAVIKRIYKAPGEGQFSDADARAVYGMLFGPERYEEVNKKLIADLKAQLQDRLGGEKQPANGNRVGRFVVEEG